MVLFETEEALPNIVEEQSPTYESVLADLAPKVETADIHKIEEEEGLSSTPRHDDREGYDAVNESQADDAPKEQIKRQVVNQRQRTNEN